VKKKIKKRGGGGKEDSGVAHPREIHRGGRRRIEGKLETAAKEISTIECKFAQKPGRKQQGKIGGLKRY